MQNNTQESWEWDIDDKIGCCGGDYCAIDHNGELKSFIRQLLTKQAEEINEAVEGLKKEVDEFPYSYSETLLFHTKTGYNSALSDALTAIKQVINK